jgi:hypothetical protein
VETVTSTVMAHHAGTVAKRKRETPRTHPITTRRCGPSRHKKLTTSAVQNLARIPWGVQAGSHICAHI